MAQMMPLPLTLSCFSKIQIGFYLSGTGPPRVVPDKGPLNGCVFSLSEPNKTEIRLLVVAEVQYNILQ